MLYFISANFRNQIGITSHRYTFRSHNTYILAVEEKYRVSWNNSFKNRETRNAKTVNIVCIFLMVVSRKSVCIIRLLLLLDYIVLEKELDGDEQKIKKKINTLCDWQPSWKGTMRWIYAAETSVVTHYSVGKRHRYAAECIIIIVIGR